jgi:hypothetical protein
VNSVDQALQNQLKNIQSRTNKTLEDLYDIIRKSGLTKHGQIRDMLKKELEMGHGDANTLTTFYINSVEEPKSVNESGDALDDIYVGVKANLRPIHEKLMTEIKKFGPVEIVPKKTYVSLRQKKQFAMIGPATNTRIDVGINDKMLQSTTRLIAMPAGSMCPFKVSLTSIAEVDAELLDWIKASYIKAK